MKKKNMKVAFYKAFQPKATFLDKIIAIFSFGRYSHVELVFPNGDCFSISPRDNGGRFKKISLNEEQWEIIELDSVVDARMLRARAKKFVGFKYDYIGAIFSIMPFCIQKNKRIFCSEVVANLLRNSPVFSNLRDGCIYSPSELYRELKDV